MYETLQKIKEIYTGADGEMLVRAYAYAEKAHSAQKRASGEPYFIHPCEVAKILIDLGMNAATIAAALLHDVTKELTVEEHLSLLDSAAEPLNEDVRAIAALLHAQSATVCIRREFAPFATERVLSAVACHTAGRADMSVFDKILFIADYIEDGRTYSSCVGVRERLYAHLDAMDVAPTLALDEALLSALDHTVTTLVGRGARICLATILARNALLDAISHA